MPELNPSARAAGPQRPRPDDDRPALGYPARNTYGTATTDPLGRTVTHDAYGKRFGDRLPRYPCPKCDPTVRPLLPLGHKGDHYTANRPRRR